MVGDVELEVFTVGSIQISAAGKLGKKPEADIDVAKHGLMVRASVKRTGPLCDRLEVLFEWRGYYVELARFNAVQLSEALTKALKVLDLALEQE